MHIENLYRPEVQKIFNFRSVYVLEKIHGTSSHLSWKAFEKHLGFFSGGEKYENFISIFDIPALTAKFTERYADVDVMINGEAYGGRQQGMSATYGKENRFIVFDVRVNGHWLDVPNAEKVAHYLGLEFVWWDKVISDSPEDMQNQLDKFRDQDSRQAIRNGMGEGHKAEGIVIRPPFEFVMNNGEPLRVKHKREDFQERKNQPKEAKDIKVLEEANAIADEWVTPMRFFHVIDKMPGLEKKDVNIAKVIAAMLEDVLRESAGEIVDSKEARQSIAKRTVSLFKRWCNGHLKELDSEG